MFYGVRVCDEWRIFYVYFEVFLLFCDCECDCECVVVVDCVGSVCDGGMDVVVFVN